MDLLCGRQLHPSSVPQHPPPTPSPILSRDLLQPWDQSFPSAPGSLPARQEFGLFGENQEIGIWSFLLHSRNKNVASTEPNRARFLWHGLLRLSGSTRANGDLFHSWSISPTTASLVCAGGAGRGPSLGGTPRVRPSQESQSSSSDAGLRPAPAHGSRQDPSASLQGQLFLCQQLKAPFAALNTCFLFVK